MTKRIDGQKIADGIIEKLKLQSKPKKIFATILVGNNQTSISFIKQKQKIAKELDIDFRIYNFPETIKNDKLRQEIGRIAGQKPVGGAIVQLPLPENINPYYVLNAIPREKDVDVLTERALGAFYTSRNPVLPPAVGVVDAILTAYDLRLTTLKTAVVGAGVLVGKPIAVWLMNNKVKKITIFEKDSDLSELKEYDLVISGIGRAGVIKSEILKDNALLIDFGYSIVGDKIFGDFDISSVISHESSVTYTPTPGGTGPILVAKIFENFYKLNTNY